MNIIELDQKEVSVVSGGGTIADIVRTFAAPISCFISAALIIGRPRVHYHASCGSKAAGLFSREYFKVTGVILLFLIPFTYVGNVIGASIDYVREKNKKEL